MHNFFTRLLRGKSASLFFLLFLLFSVAASAADRRLQRAKRLPMIGPDSPGNAQALPAGNLLKSAAKIGPGLSLFGTTYDFMTNNSMGRHIHNYSDGTMAIARTSALGAIGTWPDRGTMHVFNDGSAWLLPAAKVETGRAGWGNISALSQGEEVIASHAGLQVNVDALKGFGIWTASVTGEYPISPPGSDLTWPRVVVDGKNNIHIVVTYFTFDPFPGLGGGTYPVYARSTDGGLTWSFRFLFQKPGAAPGDPPDTTGGLWVGGGDSDSYAIDAWGDKVGVIAWTIYTLGDGSAFRGQDILFAESTDNGATWTWQNISNTGTAVPPATGSYAPTGHLDLIYDTNGVPHVIWGNFLALPDSAGLNANMFLDTLAPLSHWSPTTGASTVVSRADIVDADINAFPGSETWARGNGSGLFWPSIGVGNNNTLYLIFSAPTANDVDADTVDYLDIYATGSADGGRTWGSPAVNITNSPGTEDKYGSLAKLVDDSLRIVYGSDEVNGGIVQPGNQTTNSATVYLGFAANQVPTTTSAVADRPTGVPEAFALEQNYPNPFNPSTSIAFSLPASVGVKLEVYNMIGQKVATLVNGKLAAGNHTINWEARDVPSGIYFYKLEAANFSQTRKMLLMK